MGLEDDGGGTPTGHIINRDFSTGAGTLIGEVLLPALTRKMSSGLYYSVATSVSGINRGTFTDTRQTATSNTRSFAGGFYKSISTPTGAASTITTYYLNMLA